MMTTDRTFYTEHLKACVLPFWERAFDDEAGGLFTCWTNDGKSLISTDKYTWSQARMLWCLSYMLVNLALEENQHNRYRTRAGQLYDLLRGAILPGPDEGCAFLLTREGEAKEPIGGSGLYTSLYADCFVAIAFARWAVAAKEMGILEEALAVHGKTMALIERGIIKTEPYPLPAGSEAQGVLMILCHTATELSLALAHFGDGRAAQYRGEAQAHAHRLLDHFVDNESMQLKEVVVQEGRQTTLLERHRNPGHTVECMWFLLDALGGERLQEIETILITALSLGWDEEYGGLFRYVDCEGGEPRGERGADAFSSLVADTWDYKLWWPHAEALYATSRLYEATGNPALALWYERVKAYTFATFPSAEEGMEWIQIRRREGEAEDRVVALPVKDPYHIIRALLLLITDKGTT